MNKLAPLVWKHCIALLLAFGIPGIVSNLPWAIGEDEQNRPQSTESDEVGVPPQKEKQDPFKYPGMILHRIHVADTDPDLGADRREHLAYIEPDVKPRGQLLVYLPGTHDTAKEGGWINSVAAHQGYHVLSITYRSGIGVAIFRKSEDPQAFEKARNNILYGSEPIGPLKISPAESILNRLVKALIYLDKTYPKEGWGAYLDKDHQPVWSKFCLTGLSQGGGHACILGVQHHVARVVSFGAPKDSSLFFHKPASWYSLTSKTPKSCFFCFVHSLDEGHGCSYKEQVQNYKALGLFPRFPIVDVDDNAAPYKHTRLLTTHWPADVPKHNHGVVIGHPQYADAWIYMLTEPCP